MRCNNCKHPITPNDETIMSKGDHGYVIHADCTRYESQPTTERYTVETLTPINGRFLNTHFSLHESDVKRVNNLVALIESTRADIPQDGDIVICEKPDGTVMYAHAHLEKPSWADEGEMTGCTQAMTPYINTDGKCNASGGYWFSVKPGEVTYAGKDTKRFWTWGHMGAIAHGGVEFYATVNVWKLVDTKNRIY